MAYAALVSLAQTLDLSLNHDKYSIFVGTKEKLASITANVIFLLSFLEDFPAKANCFEFQITDTANKIEDLIELFALAQIHWRIQFVGPLIGGVTRVLFERDLKVYTDYITAFVVEIQKIRKRFIVEDEELGGSPRGCEDGPVVVGIHDDDLKAIKKRLCGESSKLEVVPIVGMGGIGKTTLARNAYDDPLMMELFDLRVWVTISQDYSAREVLLGLIDSMKLMSGHDEIDEMRMGEKVYKNLKYRRYLIVMDDVWSTKAWDDVRNVFPNDGNGSRIILTTRLSDVATYADSGSPPHEMQFLDENQSWDLLKSKVFTGGSCPPELEDMGMEISRRCRGLPLAVVLIAGILSAIKRTQASWGEIASDVDSFFYGNLEKILSLSYTHLPQHLKPCFLYFAAFPKDHDIRVSRLIKLWVAEGFLKLQKGYKTLEEEAEEYLEDLVGRNLVLVTSRKTNGKIKSCSLHDLVRDMCLRKAEEEKLLLHVSKRSSLPGNMKNHRRVSILRWYGELNIRRLLNPTIHTIFHFSDYGFVSVRCIKANFILLRVMDALGCRLHCIPLQVFDLFHLRYLALDLYSAGSIPSSVKNLENLQTLIIGLKRESTKASFDETGRLPLEIWSLPQIRHLVFVHPYALHHDNDDGDAAPALPLEHLQTLSTLANVVLTEKMLIAIPNLKKLGLLYDLHEDYQFHNLMHLQKLEKLSVNICVPCLRGRNPVFPRALRKLSLRGGRFPWGDMAMVGSLPSLEVLKLTNHACIGDTWETTDGEFGQLKYLLIEESNLEHWITESSHFPRLKRLVLRRCRLLAEIPDDIGGVSALEVIEVDDLNQSLVSSAYQIQEEQRDYGNDALQIRCIHVNQVLVAEKMAKRGEERRKRSTKTTQD